MAVLCPCHQAGQGTAQSLVITLLSMIQERPGASLSQKKGKACAGPSGDTSTIGLSSRWVMGAILPREVTGGSGRREPLGDKERLWAPADALLHRELPLSASTSAQSRQRRGRKARSRCAKRRRWGCRGRAPWPPHLQVKTSVRSLQVLHLTKQHQWNLQLHCQTLVYWWVL